MTKAKTKAARPEWRRGQVVGCCGVMMDRNLKIGDAVSPAPTIRGITNGPELDAPIWFALRVAPQKERAVTEFLRMRDVFAFYPVRERQRRIRGVVRRYDCPEVPGIVYAQFRQAPQWDVMKYQRRLITGVFCRDGIPMEIPRDVIRHLQGLKLTAERLAQARRDLSRIRPGDRARLIDGPLAGFMVDITEVARGEAVFEFLIGGKGRADLVCLERLTATHG